MSQFDERVLARLPVVDLVLTLYLRHCFLPISQEPDPLRTRSNVPSRWRTPEGTLYLAEDELTVWCELCRWQADLVDQADPTGGVGLTDETVELFAERTLGEPVVLRALVRVRLTLSQVVDFTDPDTAALLGEAGIAQAALIADDFGPCPEIAQLGEQRGWTAIRAPSAAREGGVCLALFASGRPTRQQFELVRRSARPTVAAAAITRYRKGQRPSWLVDVLA